MGISWTKEQQQVIQLKNRNLLVSAAAGSGKTAVLVERIVQRVLDPDHPVDIDRMLIVTFTKAAAAEMRERVSQAIERRMEQDPENAGLRRQYTLVHHAQITTIDSFCLYVVRSYFQTIDLEPSFRIADPGELQLLKADLAAEVMEQHYQKNDPDFCTLADHYATAKSDAMLTDFMLRLYDFSQSYPWPEEWLASLADHYRLDGPRQMQEQGWMKGLLQYLRRMINGLKKQAQHALSLCMDSDGPAMYGNALQDDLSLLDALGGCGSYEEYSRLFQALSFTKLGVNRKYEGSTAKQEAVKAIRKTVKDTLGRMRDTYFYQDLEQMLSDMQKILPDVQALSALALAFSQAYRERKKEHHILDFSDLEHFALQILIDSKTKKTTAAARELREVYEEIMIDEYQDSNYVQETILKAVSRQEAGQNNIFMVGDVKQSIYRFRLARPELFIEKYRTYTREDSACQKIDLHQNFRSRKETVESINQIFYKIMHEDLGNVEYDAQAALYAGASYPKPQQDLFGSELLLAQADAEALAQAGMDSGQEFEARMAAARIREMLETQLVTDRESGNLRPARYRDIVILLRSTAGWADTFLRVFTACGIPAHTSSQTGYFGTVEIQTILSMLSILDNPLQDIPLAAVLASPIGGFTGEELAQIKVESQQHFYYQALLSFAGQDTSGQQTAFESGREQVRQKAVRFLTMYEKLRAMTPYTPIRQLIQTVLQETGYASYVEAMPAGRQRRANVDMLLEKAVAYEQTSYKGLFHFVRYIEKLKKYEIDFGEADITSENEDVVRIMSIHKSKGLEFPIVFVCGMGKQFNRQDTRNRLILHPEYGIGLDAVDTDQRIRKPGFIKKILENEILMENQGEELRILYVALTRAKEKLVMTGTVKEELPAVSDAAGIGDYLFRSAASCYLDWIYPCVVSGKEYYQVRVYHPQDINVQTAVEAAIERLDRGQVQKLYRTADPDEYQALDQRLSWIYPYETDTDLKTKISVSEWKKQWQEQQTEQWSEWVEWNEWIEEERETQALVPAFLRADAPQEINGAMRGSAVHKIMEEVDFVRSIASGNRTDDIRDQIGEMLAKQHITPEMERIVPPRLIGRFLDSPLAARMAQAQQSGTLHREQPFVMGIPASRVYDGASGELVLLQGIVDVYWEEDGELVILDYKTDHVRDAGKLKQRYALQLDLYAQALSRATGKKVKEKMLYAFELRQAVYL